MDVLTDLLFWITTQATSMVFEGRQLIGLAAAFLLALLAAHVGWHGTDRVIAWRGRTDEQ